jgi:GT2 family glycosyltransferase
MAIGYEKELIQIVDDSSTDNTKQVIENYGFSDRTHIIERNDGYKLNPSHTWNVGHSLCTSDVIVEQGGEVCHLNDCVTPLSESCVPGTVVLARVYAGPPSDMQRIKNMMEDGTYQYPEDITAGDYITEAGTWRAARSYGIDLYCGKERQVPFLFLGAIHRLDFEKVGGYNESLRDRNDTDLANRLHAVGVKFKFLGNAIAFHLQHNKS